MIDSRINLEWPKTAKQMNDLFPEISTLME